MNYQSIAETLRTKAKETYDTTDHFSVLLPLINIAGQTHLLFEVRSLELENQPGEICFPGGRIEKGEKPSQTALRETREELNLDQHQVKIIGSLPPLTTPFNVTIHPYCGVIQHTDYNAIDFSKDEVDSIFAIPLSSLLQMKPQEHRLRYRMEHNPSFPYEDIPNGKSYDWKTGTYQILFYYFEDKVIWGLTAKMLRLFLDSIRSLY